MDSFINLAKQGIQKYEESQSHHGQQGQGQSAPTNVTQGQGEGQYGQGQQGQGQYSQGQQGQGQYGQTGGAQYNAPSHSEGGLPSAAGPHFNDDHVVSAAEHQSGGSGNKDLFASALGFIKSQSGQHESAPPVNEHHVQQAHEDAYSEKGAGKPMDASSMGAAAALQAFKKFTGGGTSTPTTQSHGSSGGGDSQSKLIGLAMAEASKLFDSKGGAASGNKQDAVNGAAATVVKLLIQSKLSGGGSGTTTGGANSGGLGSLMGLASKFLK